MAKKKKQRKKKPQTPSGGYKRFMKDFHETIDLLEMHDLVPKLSNEFKKKLYKYNFSFRNPEAANENVTSKELKIIKENTKVYYKQRSYDFRGKKVSTYQLQLSHRFFSLRANQLKKKEHKDHGLYYSYKKLEEAVMNNFYGRYLLDYFRTITRISDPTKKYFGAIIRPAKIHKENPRIEIVSEIYAFPARKKYFNINNNYRPAFQLSKATGEKPITWLCVNTSLLGKFYTGEKKELEMFIQSHALKRLKERLDLLDDHALNYVIWDNNVYLKNFEFYKNYILFPFKIFGVKIGYLVANIVDDKLLYRTFLFITHNSTPEGDKLKRITGLGKHDISYWKIDRLSTFVNLDEEKYPTLLKLFEEAGLGELKELKDKEFDVDTMQEANLDGLLAYMKQGQQD